MTTKVTDPTKRNCVIMGRKTYVGIPENKRPLPKRLNIVLSATTTVDDYPADVLLCKSLPEALALLNEGDLVEDIENVWIVGGNQVYKDAMQLPECDLIYLTKIMAEFECDAFFPTIGSAFRLIGNPADVPSEVQEENGIQYRYLVYQKHDSSA